jgi:hypothetical protein
MAFSYRASSRPRTSAKGTVFAVGRRVYVACSVARVTLTDEAGEKSVGSLKRGTQVEIVAWRPLGPDGTRYRVRSPLTGVEGWLGVGNISGVNSPVPTRASGRTRSQ